MKRSEILNLAEEYVSVDRAETHGDAEDSFHTIGMLWGVYLGRHVSATDVAALMTLLKVARIKNNPGHADNWVDLAGYAACGGEIATEQPKPIRPTSSD